VGRKKPPVQQAVAEQDPDDLFYPRVWKDVIFILK
jgi:hypothetical protein